MSDNPQTSSQRWSFASLSPWSKVGLWLVTLAALAGIVQLGAWTVGLEFNVWGHSGRGVLLTLAVGILLAMMAAEGRPPAEYGLVFPEGWWRQLLQGIGVGGLTYAGYCTICVLTGAADISTDKATLYRWITASLAGLAALPLALTQQVIFSGYLLGLFRRQLPRAAAVALVAALFALATRLESPQTLFAARSLPLTCGMFLVAAMLCLLRLRTGALLAPTAIMTGWLFVRRLVKSTHLLAIGDRQLAAWFFPQSDPRQAPALLAIVGAVCVWYWWRLRIEGDRQALETQAVSTSMKRVAPFSNVCMLAPLDLWLGRLSEARWTVGVKYVPRLLAILAFSSLNTLLALPERLLAPLLLAARRVKDPVFILGVHRSGTTHLHNLMALDDQFTTPRAYQIMNPVGFLFSGWLLTPLLGAFSPWKRPMDSVRFHIFAPNEEEFALAGLTKLSPYWGLTFPRQVVDYDRFIFPEDFTVAELQSWKGHYLTFLRKLTLWSGKRPLLKNPHNTARVGALLEMFPQARLVHIYRHPHAVYRSNLHMAREGHCVHQLQDPDEQCNYASRFLDNYAAMETSYYRYADPLPVGQAIDVAYEKLDRDPIGAIREIYQALGLEFTPRFQRRLEAYLETVKDYEKNRFKPTPIEEQRLVYKKLSGLFERWGYPQPAEADATERRAA